MDCVFELRRKKGRKRETRDMGRGEKRGTGGMSIITDYVG
jgi:hypothetical protein